MLSKENIPRDRVELVRDRVEKEVKDRIKEQDQGEDGFMGQVDSERSSSPVLALQEKANHGDILEAYVLHLTGRLWYYSPSASTCAVS